MFCKDKQNTEIDKADKALHGPITPESIDKFQGITGQQLLDAIMGERNEVMEEACNHWDKANEVHE